MLKTVTIDFELMNYIDQPPTKVDDLFTNACRNDSITVKSWRKVWVDQAKENHKKYGPFKNNHIGTLHNKFKNQPCIVMGSGPDLKENIKQHIKAKEQGINIVSVLHNFHYCVDNGVKPDYFVSLDAGHVTIEEISEGGEKKTKDGLVDHEYYLEQTKNHTLLAYIGSHPDLLKSWRGKILFFSCPIPDATILKELSEIEPFHCHVSSGGNVLGASTYVAKAILGCNPIIWTGASFSFSYDKKFHPWNSKYDGQLGKALRAIDIYGNKRLTWQSYFNFKNWFEYITIKVLGQYINATEGGILGAYPEGNIRSIQQMPLESVIKMYSLSDLTKKQMTDVAKDTKEILF